MKKKIFAGLLSAMMVVSLAACGSSETGATATESKSETTANTADGTAAAATDAQGGYEGKEVKVLGLNIINDLVKIEYNNGIIFVNLNEIEFDKNKTAGKKNGKPRSH